MWFTTASLTPALLLGLGSLFGGIWPAFALLSMTVLAVVMDRLPGPATAAREGRWLTLVLGAVHLVLCPLAVHGVIHSGDNLNSAFLFVGYALFFGQISNSNAHELIHQGDRFSRRLGTLVYGTLLHGHHVTAHLKVHHVWAASRADPNSARRDEGFYRYLARAVPGEFLAGLRAETRRPHPYLAYAALALATLVMAWSIGGLPGMALWFGIALYAQVQLFLSDYVQHYGLTRALRPDGKLAPLTVDHSWNAPQWYSAAMMLNAARHSDHHLTPKRPYTDLKLDAAMPMLPHALPIMAVIALWPPLWRRVMNRRLDALAQLQSGQT